MPATMPTLAPSPLRPEDIAVELDRARRSGPLQRIVIPPCPELLARLRQAMAQAEPDLAEVAAIAGQDVAMAATLIRRANGPLQAVAQPVSTVGQAMNRLGLQETARVMTEFLAQRAMPVNHPQLQRFWERSSRRATAMAFIARQLPGLSPDLAHTFGLFCHVGMPVLLQCVRGYGGTLVEADARIDRSPVATENANHQTDHAVVGALVCRVWHFTPHLVAAVRLHHDLDALGDGVTEPEVHTLVAAGLVAEHLMRRAEAMVADREWLDHAAAALQWLAIGADDVQMWEEQLAPVFDAM
jgi:HD-like signal output (HDOD) protein